MLHNTFCRRLAALVLTLAVAVSAVLPVFAVYPMPVQTATETEAVYLFNADTGKTILNQNADQQKYVASLTKLMTALLLVESGKDLNGEVTVPTDLTQEFKDIQNANGTTMGLRIGTETYYKYLQAFGLMEKTGVDMIGEVSGIFASEESFNSNVVSLASYSFGQTFNGL